jgi:CubicO group peptidase (beta-lactamase class C family)
MFRRPTSTTAALTIAAVAALTPAAAFGQTSPTAPAPTPPPIAIPAPAPPPPEAALPPGPQTLAPKIADPAKMAQLIALQMTNQAFGWQFAIAQGGKFVTASALGTARSKADNGGVEMKMKPTTRYEIASLTKNVTAVATMKLLRLRGLNVNSPIHGYLPASWKRGKGFGATDAQKVTFAQLLTHTSGAYQTTQLPACKDVCGNDWDGLAAMVKIGVVPGSSRVYKNANYALLRVLNARMWKAAGGKIMGTKTEYVEGTNYKGDEIKKPVQVPYVLPINAATDGRYAMDFVKRFILTPAGIKNVGCVAADPSTAGLNYAPGATQKTKGQLMYWPQEQCPGNAGLRLSSIEIVQYLAHLRHGTIIDPADLAKMDELRAGWREANNLGAGTPAGVYWHGGGLQQADRTTILHTCGITFPDGTEASLIVNSAMGNLNKCKVLRDAWIAAS